MSFLEDLARYGLPLAGGAAGTFFGGPVGGAIGGSIGNMLGSAFQGDAGRSDIENLQYNDPRSDPAYAGALANLKRYSTGEVLPEDRMREAHALEQSSEMARGETGAVQARAQSQGGGNVGLMSVLENQANQGAAQRLSHADIDTAGMASDRGRQASEELMHQLQTLSQMQNQFAAMKSGKLADISSSEQSARNANFNSAWGGAMNLYGGIKPRDTAQSVSDSAQPKAPAAQIAPSAQSATQPKAPAVQIAPSAQPAAQPSLDGSTMDWLRRAGGGWQ